ncbi:MAG: HvfC/BufC family peptide modification chaperone [Arenimonas sp.]
MSNALLDMQRDFLTSLRLRDGTRIENSLTEKPVSKPGLRTYIHAYSSRLVEALNNDHPCLGEYLGDTLWHEMCVGYIEQYPSMFRSLRNFGDLLPEYLLHAQAFSKHPEIAELAQLERQFLNCFDAMDADRVHFSEFQKLHPEQWQSLGLMLHPSLQLLELDYNSVALWQDMKDRKIPQATTKNKNYWLLWRDTDRVTNFRSLENTEYRALANFSDKENFSALCEKLAGSHAIESVPAIAIDFIRQWCDQGLISAIVLD